LADKTVGYNLQKIKQHIATANDNFF